jgi:hypothetical protein
MAISARGHVYRSEDAGRSFRRIATLPLAKGGNTWSQIVYAPKNQQLVAGTDLGPFVSTDEGTSWVAMSFGTQNPAEVKVTALAVDETDEEVVLATSLGVIRRLKDAWCFGPGRCFTVSLRNVPRTIHALYAHARGTVREHLGL